MSERHAERRGRALRVVRQAGAEALLVSSVANVRWLTGFTGDDSYLLLGPRNAMVISDSRYEQQLGEECPGLEVVVRRAGTSLLEATVRVVRQCRVGRLAVEGQSLAAAAYLELAAKLAPVEVRSTSGLVERLRQVKDREELAAIRQAIAVAERGFAVLRATLHAEQTEKEMADALEHQLRLLGAEGASFPSIVAVGDRAALPHYRPGGRRVGQGRFVLVDWGARVRGYVSDLTRLIPTSRIPPKLERVYRIVQTAQAQAIRLLRPGAVAGEVDAAARAVIADAGFGKRFGHGLGHGIGLEVHEGPRLAPGSKTVLQPGMVVTVEPGIYLPGWGGVRLEDDVLITRHGPQVLTSISRNLAELALP